MKRLILIGGPMGVGKSSAARALAARLDKNVRLDGDWCWMARPFVVSEETKRMVLENIRFLLGRFLRCAAYENVIFSWVMQRQEIVDSVLEGLPLEGVELLHINLIASPDALAARVKADVAAGLRDSDAPARSLAYLRAFEEMAGRKLDVSALSPEEVAAAIEEMLRRG